MVLWGYPPLIYFQTGNQKRNSEIYQLDFVKQVVSRWFKQWIRSVCWVCVFTQKGTLLTSFHIHSFFVFHSDLQKNTIVTCILTSRNHIMSNMQNRLLQYMQLIQYRHVSLFSTVITNEFIGQEFYPSPNSLDGYEAMRFDVTQLTQDEEQSSFTLKTDMPIPMLVYGDSFKWAKYGHHIPTVKSRFDKQ